MKKENRNLIVSRMLIFCISMGIVYVCVLAVGFAAVWGTSLIWIQLLLTVLSLIGAGCGYRFILRPYLDTTQKLNYLLNHPGKDGFLHLKYHYNRQVQQLMEYLQEYMTASSTLELSKRQAQYQALQNQINPHFLYNTLESIRSEALMSGLESVASMCESLANFFRYTISNMENLVTVEQELENIRTYFYIQQYRFGERLSLKIQCDPEEREEVLKCLIPKLTLQPIVENAIIHGIERMIGPGQVVIDMVMTEQRLIIQISDNGIGMDRETLNRINQHMMGRDVRKKGRGGIAIGNVNNRIKMLFGENYGVAVYSTQGVGTDVEITLPRTTEQERKVIQRRAEEME